MSTESPKSSKGEPKGANGTLRAHYGDTSHTPSKHSISVTGREDSVSSKTSSASIFPAFNKSLDYSSSFSINHDFVPRPQKTLNLFGIMLSALNDLKEKYSSLIKVLASSEKFDEAEISNKVDHRIFIVQSLQDEYKSLLEEKEVEIERIKDTLTLSMSNKSGKEDLDSLDCESYWSICRELCFIELKLEKCCGKLQFQIIELDSVSRVNHLDQYELSIRFNEAAKFKTRIKIEKNGHQVWDNITFAMAPSVEDSFDVKFSELKTLNKAVVLLEKKLSLVNNLILAEPSIFTFWLNYAGTIKLKTIVQWNANLEDPDISFILTQIQNKFQETNTSVRRRSNSPAQKYSQNRLSVNLGNLFKSQVVEKMSSLDYTNNKTENIEEENIVNVSVRNANFDRKADKIKARKMSSLDYTNNKTENIEEENIVNVSVRNANFDRKADKIKARYQEDFCSEKTISGSLTSNLNTASIVSSYTNNTNILSTIIVDNLRAFEEKVNQEVKVDEDNIKRNSDISTMEQCSPNREEERCVIQESKHKELDKEEDENMSGEILKLSEVQKNIDKEDKLCEWLDEEDIKNECNINVVVRGELHILHGQDIIDKQTEEDKDNSSKETKLKDNIGGGEEEDLILERNEVVKEINEELGICVDVGVEDDLQEVSKELTMKKGAEDCEKQDINMKVTIDVEEGSEHGDVTHCRSGLLVKNDPIILRHEIKDEVMNNCEESDVCVRNINYEVTTADTNVDNLEEKCEVRIESSEVEPKEGTDKIMNRNLEHITDWREKRKDFDDDCEFSQF